MLILNWLVSAVTMVTLLRRDEGRARVYRQVRFILLKINKEETTKIILLLWELQLKQSRGFAHKFQVKEESDHAVDNN